jgi:hypothetical protein
MTDAERGEVGHDRFSLCESKVAIQLHSIRSARNVPAADHDSRNHTTEDPGSVPRFSVSALTPSLA